MLHHDTYGAPDLPKLLMIHGLFGQGRNWAGPAKALSDIRHVTTVDLRNHGQSPWAAPHDYASMAADVIPFTPADVLGHSMGGKAAMTLALTKPHQVNRLIVADIAPVPYAHSQRAVIDAIRNVDTAKISRRSEVVRALKLDRPTAAFLAQSFDMGTSQWSLNVEQLSADMEKILGFPEINQRFEGPTLFLRGSESDYVRPEHHDVISELFPNAQHQTIPNAGHWLHADQPQAVIDAIRDFLS